MGIIRCSLKVSCAHGIQNNNNWRTNRLPTFPVVKRLVSLVLFAWMAQAPFAYSGFIELQPGTTFAGTGDSISLDLTISGLGNYAPDSLGAFDISIGFDASALTFSSYSLGNSLGNVNLLEAIDGSAGPVGDTVNIAEVSLLSVLNLNTMQPGAFALATLNFNVIDLALGATTELSILPGVVLASASGSSLSATTSGSASVKNGSSIPIPGTLLLLMTSLFSWLALTKNRHSLRQVK